MIRRTIILTSLTALALTLAACATNPSGTAADGARASAITCAGCKTTWVRTRTSYGADYVVKHDGKQVTICTGCDATARKYLGGESTTTTCPHCGHQLIESTAEAHGNPPQ